MTRAIVVLCALLPCAALAQPYSELWGREGERWRPRGRLPDFSYAGYHAGRDRIPDVPRVVHADDFGARPGDNNDDSGAIQRAIDAAERRGGGAVVLSRGRYIVRNVIRIRGDGIVLRGQGRDDTTLFVPRSLRDARDDGSAPAYLNAASNEELTRGYGFIQVGPGEHGAYGAGSAVAEDAQRGDRRLTLQRIPDGLRAGSFVRLEMTPRQGDRSLWDERHNDQNDSPHAQGANSCDEIYGELGFWIVRVVEVDRRQIVLDQPLRADVRARWNPRVEVVVRSTREVGIESLEVRFEETAYPGHHLERGYNAIDFAETGPVINAWIRGVRITNADNAIQLNRAKHVTVRGVVIGGNRSGERDGHHGVTGGIDCLYEDIEINARLHHAITFAERTTGTVLARGTGSARWSLDHHSRAQIENLITDLRVSYDWISGGGACAPHAGARHVYWRFDRPIDPPTWSEMQTTIVGELNVGEQRGDQRQWFERAADIHPRNLYEAQLARRLAIEDRGRFGDTNAARRADWNEGDAGRWAIADQGGDRRYWLATSVYDAEDGRLGEHSVFDTAPLSEASIRGRARTFELLRANDGADYALIAGWRGPDDHYFALFHADRDRSGIYRVEGGVRTRIARADRSLVRDDDWHRVELRRSGDALEMLADGEIVASAIDTTFMSGKVGIGSLDDSALFDDLAVASPDLVPGQGGGDETVLAFELTDGNEGANDDPDVERELDGPEDPSFVDPTATCSASRRSRSSMVLALFAAALIAWRIGRSTLAR